MGGGGGVTWGGKVHMCQMRTECAKKIKIHMVRKIPEYKRATNAQVIVVPKARDSRSVSDSNSGHVQVANHKTFFSSTKRRESALYQKPRRHK
jgi:hypothetical protein